MASLKVTGVQTDMSILCKHSHHCILETRICRSQNQSPVGPRNPRTPVCALCTSWTLCTHTQCAPCTSWTLCTHTVGLHPSCSLCNLKTLAVVSFHSWQDCTSWWPWGRVWVRFIRLMWEGHIIIQTLGFRFRGPRTGKAACFGES